MKTDSLSGNRYILLFTDDYSRMSWVYFLILKSEAFEMFKKFHAYVEKKTNSFIKFLSTYRCCEFCSKEFDEYYEKYGIRRELTTPRTPQQKDIV